MTLDTFLKILHAHLAALESSAWPVPHNVSNGPALFLDAADTRELIAELTRLAQHPAALPARPQPSRPA